MSVTQHALGQTITGRCVTMGGTHKGVITKVINAPAEYTLRYQIDCEDGRARIVFAEGVVDPLEFGDSGAPRGESRYWHVKYHGVIIFNSTRKSAVQQVYEAMRAAIAKAARDAGA